MTYFYIYIVGVLIMLVFLTAFDPVKSEDSDPTRSIAATLASIAWPLTAAYLLGFFINACIYGDKKESK